MMEGRKFLRAFIDDCRYYDPQKKEVRAILDSVDLRNKTILDIGTGTGRLAFPLAGYAKEVVALDRNESFAVYFKKHKKKNVRFVHGTAESYLKKPLSFDIFLLAWPTFDSEILTLVKKSMNKKSVFIFITCDNKSDWECIVDRLHVVSKKFKRDIKNKQRFLRLLPKKFEVIAKKKLHTSFAYPHEKAAFRIIKSSLDLWFSVKLNEEASKHLHRDIEQRLKGKKVIYGEDIWFYVLKR